MKSIKNFLLSFFLLFVVWQTVVVIADYPNNILPSPFSVMNAVVELFTDGQLSVHVFVSLKRFFIGYTAASFSAILLGLILGLSKGAWAIVEPIVLVLKPISPMAWSPFIILWFGIGNLPAIVTIFIATFFTLLVSSVKAVRDISPIYKKLASNLGFSRLQTLFKIVLPASFQQIASGLHMALSTSWIFLVAGELMGTNSGLGYLINDSRQILRYDLILAGISVIGILGFTFDRLITMLERQLTKKWGTV